MIAVVSIYDDVNSILNVYNDMVLDSERFKKFKKDIASFGCRLVKLGDKYYKILKKKKAVGHVHIVSYPFWHSLVKDFRDWFKNCFLVRVEAQNFPIPAPTGITDRAILTYVKGMYLLFPNSNVMYFAGEGLEYVYTEDTSGYGLLFIQRYVKIEYRRASMKQKENIPIEVKNLGSKEADKLDFSREELYKRMDPYPFMSKRATEVPVYLVNPKQMDIVSPPEYSKCIDEEEIIKWVEKWIKEIEDYKILDEEAIKSLADARDIQECMRESEECNKGFEAVGLYISEELGKQKEQELLNNAEIPLNNVYIKYPCIFICPERVIERAKKYEVDVNLCLDMVYYHELAHAVMDSKRRGINLGDAWAKVIEESLANWLSYSCFTGISFKEF